LYIGTKNVFFTNELEYLEIFVMTSTQAFLIDAWLSSVFLQKK